MQISSHNEYLLAMEKLEKELKAGIITKFEYDALSAKFKAKKNKSKVSRCSDLRRRAEPPISKSGLRT